MKYAYLALAFIVVGAGLFALWMRLYAPAHDLSCDARHPVIVAFGDSLVVGYGADQGQGFVDDVSAAIGVPIINRGVLGNTTAQGLERVNDIIALKPDIVIVLFGGNDALQRVPQETTQANLDAILAKLKEENIEVVLLGVQGGVLSDPYASMYSALSQKYGTGYVSNILSGILTNPDLKYDEVHPNAAGYARIASRVEPVLKTECGKQ